MAGSRTYMERMDAVQEKLLQFVVAAREEWGEAPVTFSLAIAQLDGRRPCVELLIQVSLDG